MEYCISVSIVTVTWFTNVNLVLTKSRLWKECYSRKKAVVGKENLLQLNGVHFYLDFPERWTILDDCSYTDMCVIGKYNKILVYLMWGSYTYLYYIKYETCKPHLYRCKWRYSIIHIVPCTHSKLPPTSAQQIFSNATDFDVGVTIWCSILKLIRHLSHAWSVGSERPDLSCLMFFKLSQIL